MRLSLLAITLLFGAVASCQNPRSAAHGTDTALPDHGKGRAASENLPSEAGDSGTSLAAPAPNGSPGYPVNTHPPKDYFNEPLLRTLAREASAIVVCRLLNLVDAFPQLRDPDIFYDAACEVIEVIAGAPIGKPLHFIWQVERDHAMPPPQSELLVYLKARKEPLDGPPPLKWVALETGVLRYTPALRKRMHQ